MTELQKKRLEAIVTLADTVDFSNFKSAVGGNSIRLESIEESMLFVTAYRAAQNNSVEKDITDIEVNLSRALRDELNLLARGAQFDETFLSWLDRSSQLN